MGTSQSSNGSPSGVPMVPPWVPDIDGTDDGTSQPSPTTDSTSTEPSQNANQISPPQQAVPIAPAGRFGNARRSLGEFARNGNSGSMRRGVGRYIQSGYGGSGTATRRFGGTAKTAQALYSALGGGTSPLSEQREGTTDTALASARSADDVMDAVVEAVRPVDGTQDAEASRVAIKDALAELLTRFPEADLLNLDEAQREFAIERYVAADVFRRFDLDVGKAIKDKAPTAAVALGRLKEVREYIKETVSAAFRNLRSKGQRLSTGSVGIIVQSALRETFTVFEEYAQ